MKLIGLTGGIASGKSTVHVMLRRLGAQVLDADAVYHELITPRRDAPSALARAIERRFPGVIDAQGSVDRVELGRRVFADAGERRALEQITHPAVAAEVGRRVRQLAEDGCEQVVYDVPLLFERGLERGMEGVILVWVPREVQLERLMARESIPVEQAEQRLAAQMPLDEKRRRATWVVDNSGDLERTRAQVERVWREVRGAPGG